MELTQIHDLIIHLFILHKQKNKKGWHMDGSQWCQCWGGHDWQVQTDDALPVKDAAASGVQQTLKTRWSFEVGSMKLNQQCLMLKHELRICLVFSLEKMWMVQILRGSEWWVFVVPWWKAKQDNIEKNLSAAQRNYVHNLHTVLLKSRKTQKSRFEHFLGGMCYRLTCTDLPLGHCESYSLNHWPYKWARRIIVRIGVSGRCKVE